MKKLGTALDKIITQLGLQTIYQSLIKIGIQLVIYIKIILLVGY